MVHTKIVVVTPYVIGSPILGEDIFKLVVTDESQNLSTQDLNVLCANFGRVKYLHVGDRDQLGCHGHYLRASGGENARLVRIRPARSDSKAPECPECWGLNRGRGLPEEPVEG